MFMYPHDGVEDVVYSPPLQQLGRPTTHNRLQLPRQGGHGQQNVDGWGELRVSEYPIIKCSSCGTTHRLILLRLKSSGERVHLFV